MRRVVVVGLTLGLLAAFAAGAVASELRKPEVPPKLRPAAVASAEVTANRVAPVGDHTFRVSGADRYATAAALSKLVWDYETTGTVYLASGQNYPDALSIGLSNFFDGPLLLVKQDAIPDATAKEIRRLQPCVIVAAGGPGAISDRVLRQADRLTRGMSNPDCRGY